MITHEVLLLVLACIFGLFMTWSVGSNDLANIMSTAMGSKAISIKQAFLIAILFEILGALLGGHDVAKTIQNGIINTQILNYPPQIFIIGMLAVLLASATWMSLASHIGVPVSITHATVGALVGLGVLSYGIHAVYWTKVWHIGLSWIICPMIASTLAYFLFITIQRTILSNSYPIRQAKRHLPFYLFIVGCVLSELTVIKALHHFHYALGTGEDILIAIGTGVLILFFGLMIIRRIPQTSSNERHKQFAYIEKMFGVLMIFTACAMVYAHGSNDVAISVGPIASIVSLIEVGHPGRNGDLIYFILTFGCLGVIAGFLTFGRKIIVTVGSGITALTPSRAFCATISAAITVVVSTGLGLPVSATQTLVGAIMGVGMARGIAALDMRILRNIFIAWIVTIPIAAGLTAIFFDIIKSLLL